MNQTQVISEITGNVWKIECAVGDKISEGETLMILESMKMEIPVEATCAGTIVEILVKEQDSVEENQLLATINDD
ncbi:MAG: biotin/lipoyl-binding carrier protein [Candidatus Azotimanducaceae bacterium]|uniref:Biotin/lipoyl-binding carrier protein n=1 Tax=OM182 bacterium TaxID=2510334 RepID=A0A520S328_9GAMM|nr:acetyl-CoA carboxylase biotin carboxyl carrier protein subunit [Gammaproteobacteria bacterium]OUV66992.1 MAG: acetyl-CoA carboxylase biotin carboxyl carrier protein subunit [Gammaproteobacteria bacterium TMED133]RZO76851.1 MAG: biotin/lipoyl-binding carrier protein [OM182 bacterium]